MKKRKRVGIIGGGPAGLSLARMLSEKGTAIVKVFEALPAVGGKSFTVYQGDTVVEMGTCYATFSHKVTNGWMREFDMPMGKLGEQRFDGADFMDYIRAGYGPMLAIQVAKYCGLKLRLENALAKPNPPAWAIEDAARPIQDWLRKHDLGKIEHFMHRSTTNIAYGFVDETPTVQALRWNDMKLIISGLMKQLKMPLEGWAYFWELVANQLTVQYGARVTRVERGAPCRITLETGETEEFDEIVCAIPLDEFNALTTPTAIETEVAGSVVWNAYTTTLIAVRDWFTDVHVEGYKEPVVPGAELGQLLSARYEGYEEELGGHLYLTGQLSGSFSGSELEEILRRDVTKRGGEVVNVILQKMWKYFARYKSEAIHDGLLSKLVEMQGQNHTWYTGAIFSHEAVSHIVTFNQDLARNMQEVFGPADQNLQPA